MNTGPEKRSEAQRYVTQGEFHRAIPLLQQALREDPADTAAYTLLGICYANTSRHVDALDAFQQAARRDPEVAKYRFNYAMQLDSVGRQVQAIGEAEAALRLDPAHAGARALRDKLVSERRLPSAPLAPASVTVSSPAPRAVYAPYSSGASCARCGAIVSVGDAFCRQCGHSLAPAAPVGNSGQPSVSQGSQAYQPPQPYQPPPVGYGKQVGFDPQYGYAGEVDGRRLNNFALACAIFGWPAFLLCPLVADLAGVGFAIAGISKGDRDYGILMLVLNSLFLVMKVAFGFLVVRRFFGI